MPDFYYRLIGGLQAAHSCAWAAYKSTYHSLPSIILYKPSAGWFATIAVGPWRYSSVAVVGALANHGQDHERRPSFRRGSPESEPQPHSRADLPRHAARLFHCIRRLTLVNSLSQDKAEMLSW